jgi:hypothetical protein|tara:strand:- start:24600 stop:24854 length:255 start_codon:yes stop_codon:yes gene_type:complete
VSDGCPRDGQSREVGAVGEGLEDQTVGGRRVKAVYPYALDLRSHLWEVVADAHGALEGGEWIAIDGGAGRTVDELVERIALASV